MYYQIDDNILITGDFNSWHSLWGSTTNNSRGEIIADYITESNMVVFNDGSPTHFSTRQSFTNIDLTFGSPYLKIHSDWKTIDDLHGSDHFPILIKLFIPSQPTFFRPRPKFIIDKAEWIKFNELSAEFDRKRPRTNDINKEASNLQKIIIQSAILSLPQFNPSIKKKVPWWYNCLHELKKEKNKFWHILRGQ